MFYCPVYSRHYYVFTSLTVSAFLYKVRGSLEKKKRFLGMSDFRIGEKRRFYIMQRERKGGSILSKGRKKGGYIVLNIVHKREDIEL